MVKYNCKQLKLIETPFELKPNIGEPESFYIKNNSIHLYPTPIEKGLVTIDYFTLAIGESADGNEIYSLKKGSDSLNIPTYLEELMKDAIITRTMLNSIASESDENYSAYLKQADKAYKRLIKYSKGISKDKKIRF